jgi:diguanylate cyclase (GGDEF)-like protein
MSFRSRLTLFFVLIVIVPMVSVTLVIFRLISDNERGKANAQVAAREQTAINLEREALAEADRAARLIAADPALATALARGDRVAAERRARAIVPRLRIERLLVVGLDKHAIADVGRRDAAFPATRKLLAGGRPVGTLQVSVETAATFARIVNRVTTLHVVVRRRGHPLATTLPVAANVALPPSSGELKVSGRKYRVATFTLSDFRGGRLQVSLLRDERRTQSAVDSRRLVVAAILLGFFILAFVFAVAVSRSLQRQIASFLEAARRLGSGEFHTKVPTVGRDEFAALGQEFNTMAAQLEQRLEQLREERTRVERSMRRLGEAVASNLDREALLGVVVETAVDGAGAEGGRASARRSGEGPLEELATAGALDGLDDVLAEAETIALASGRPSEASRGELHALGQPLHGSEGGPGAMGVVSVGRHGRQFSEADRELFSYLAGQAAVSIENVGLHETVQRQAVTDELTGLFNHRRFQEVLAAEVERSRRFPEQPLGLVLLDIDNFKRVNDTYGHQQGDLVLREVARVLRESSREIDAPSRYGGEELAVVLPGTDLEGAYDMAERVRSGIEALELAVLGSRDGEVLRVTASFGAAAFPEAGTEGAQLIAAADAALYEAKRGGKNMTVRAGVG